MISPKSLCTAAVLLLLLGLLSGCGPLLFGTIAGGSVVYFMQERSAGVALDDFTTWAAIRSRLLQYGGSNFTDVNVDVIEGRVMLTGMVRTPKLRLDVARAAWEQDGVREVINEVQLYNDEKYAVVYARDLAITSQIKAKLLLTKNIRSVNYSIETVNSVAYIFGTAYDEDELEAVASVTSHVRGVSKVVVYVRMRKDPKRTVTVDKIGDPAALIEEDDSWNW
jgi:osmotically-inducible protein OsmY